MVNMSNIRKKYIKYSLKCINDLYSSSFLNNLEGRTFLTEGSTTSGSRYKSCSIYVHKLMVKENNVTFYVRYVIYS